MTKVNDMEMRNIEGGASKTCKCGQTFKDVKFLFWVIYSAKKQLERHQKYCIKCL